MTALLFELCKLGFLPNEKRQESAPQRPVAGVASLKVIAWFEGQNVIPDKTGQALDNILAHLRKKEQDIPIIALLTPPPRAPPETLPLFAGKGAR